MQYRNLRGIREDRDIRQREIAKILNVSQNTYSQYENGVISLTAEVLIKLADYYKVSNEEEPIFCLSNKTHTFEDGTVEECSGLGYKIYKYNRSSLGTGIQFGPLFIEMRQPEK